MVFYLSTLSVHLDEGEDSIRWVLTVTNGPLSALVDNPHHIAFLGICRFAYRIFQWCGYAGDASLPMRAINALAGAMTLGLMARILRRLGADTLLILGWVGATAVSFGFWSYSTQPETYVLPLPAISLGVGIVIGLADDRFSLWSLAWLGALMAFATLINQMHVVLIVTTAAVVVLILYRRRPEIPVSPLLQGLASYGVVAAFIIGAAYFGVAILVLGKRDLGSIMEWSKGYAPKILTNPFSITDPIKGIIGMARAVLGGHFLAGFDWFYGPFTRSFPRS
jgi:hypothetical protein